MNIKSKYYRGKEDFESNLKKFTAKNIVSNLPRLDIGEITPANKFKSASITTRVLQKSRSDYEQQLNSIFKNTGKGITNSLKKLPFGSSKIFKSDALKMNEIRDKYWENTFKEKSQSKKVTFSIKTPRIAPTENLTSLLNQEIEDFEKRLEEYKNTLKTQEQLTELYKVNYSRFA